MASEDVIELGSSDDEQISSPRKPKPRPNAMVHIPKSVSGFPSNMKKKISVNRNVVIKSKSSQKILPNPFSPLNHVKNNLPMKYLKAIPTSDLCKAAIKNTLNTTKKVNIPISHNINVQNAHVLQKHVQPQKEVKAQCLNKLPPGITVTRTLKTGQVDRKRTMPQNMPPTVIIKKPKLQNKALHKVGAVLAIEVDKDAAGTTSVSTVNPKWYMKPEDYQKAEDIEKQNIKEPDSIKYLEITIEDSPSKALPDKRVLEMGVETPIVIEDSPGKPNNKKKSDGNCTDNEDDKVNNDNCHKNVKPPHSKMRLNYPNDKNLKNDSVLKGNDVNANKDNIKIQSATITQETVPVNNETIVLEDDEVPQLGQNKIKDNAIFRIEIEDSPKKCPNDTKENNNMPEADTGDFHPFYQRFIDLCFKLEDSADMNKIVEKKLKAYYRQVPKSYVESEGFIEMISGKITAMEVTPERMYLHIKDIVDELNFQRKNSKSQTTENTRESDEAVETQVVPLCEDGEVDIKKQNQIAKLEKVLKKLHKAIQKLEEQEVNFDDDADSVYLLTDRYKERLVRVHKKICQLTNTKMPSDPRVRVEPRLGRPNGPARKVEDLVNKKGAIKSFPDFHDVLRCVKEANIEDKLGWNDLEIMEEARDLFTRCGKKLQRRRQENDWRIASYRLDDTIDPAEQSEELKMKLEKNAKIAAEKESALINRYADRQNQLNLEAVEIGDKEAEESPIESDDEVEIITENETKVDKDLVSSEKKQESSAVIDNETGDKECVVIKSPKENVNIDDDNTSNDTQCLDDNTLLVPILASDSCSDNASECLDSSDDGDDELDTEIVSIEDSSSSEDEEENVTLRQSEDGNTINCDMPSDTDENEKTLTPEKLIGNKQNTDNVNYNDHEALNKDDEDTENKGTELSAESQDQGILTKENVEVNSVDIVSLEDTQSPKDTTDTISDDICSNDNDNICKNDMVESKIDSNTPYCQIVDIRSCSNIDNENSYGNLSYLDNDVIEQVRSCTDFKDNENSNNLDNDVIEQVASCTDIKDDKIGNENSNNLNNDLIKQVISCTDIKDNEKANINSNNLDDDLVKQLDNIEPNTIDTRKQSILENIEDELQRMFE